MKWVSLAPRAAAVLLTCAALSLPAEAAPARVRGTLVEVDATRITVSKRDGGIEPITIGKETRFLQVTPIGIDEIKAGDYIGVAGAPQADGKIKALGVMVFPEAARGTAEGHFPWDLQPQSTMTNATVAKVTKAGAGREVEVTYKGGSQTIDISDNGTLASFTPADASILKKGAKVTVFAQQESGGLPVAGAVLVGKDGFTPPN